MPDTERPETQLLKGIATQVASRYVGGFLSGILGIGGGESSTLDAIRTQLQNLQTAVDQLRQSFMDFSRQIIANQAFMHAEEMIHESVSLVEGDYAILAALSNADKPSADQLKEKGNDYHNALVNIHSRMAGESLSGGNLITTAAAMLAAHITPAGYDPTQGRPLIDAYGRYENYFRGSVATQIKAVVLMQNAYNAKGEHDLAKQFSDLLPDYVHSYAMSFFNGVEMLVATYHHDSSLVEMFGAHPDLDPLRMAQAFVQRYPSATGSRLWLWNPSGTTYNVSERHRLPELVPLLPSEQPVTAEGPRGDYTFQGDNWDVGRYALPAGVQGDFTIRVPGINASANPLLTPPFRSPAQLQLTAGDGYSFATAITSAKFNAGCLSTQNDLTLPVDTPFTMECWCNSAQIGGTIFTARFYNTHEYRHRLWRVHVDNDATVKFSRMEYDGINPPQTTGLINSAVAGMLWVWHHFAVVYNGAGEVWYYVDGNLMGSTQFWMAPTSPLVGGFGEHLPLVGVMNEFRIWNRTLSTGEIRANLHQMITSGSGLVAAYGFDRGNFADRTGQQPPLATSGDTGITVFPSNQPSWLM